jgi:DNA-binding transcriptional LysR family regulator
LLEQQLGSQLLIRTTKRQQLTESGLLLYQACKPHVDALNAMEAIINDNQNNVKRKLRILLPLEFFNQVISALITKFAVLYPDVEIHCHHYSTTYPDLDHQFDHQFDLVFVLHEESLLVSNWIGKTLLSFPQSIYSGLKSKLTDGCEINDLKNYRVLLSSENEQWLFRDKENIQVLSGDIAMILSSAEMRIEACQREIGLVKLPDYIVKNNVKMRAVSLNRQVVAQQLTILY